MKICELHSMSGAMALPSSSAFDLEDPLSLSFTKWGWSPLSGGILRV